VTVADAQNCQAVVTVTIGQPAQLTATTSSTATSGGNNNGAAAVTISGGTAPYTYSWSNGMTGSSISGLAPGSYTVTVTDANGCTLTVTVVVGNGSNCTLTVAVTGNNAACGQTNGSAAAVAANGSGTVTYSWSNGMAGATITGLGAGVYVVTATDANGCTAVGAAQITTVDNTPPTVVTQNATVVLDVNGQGTLTAAMVNNGSSDACGNVTISINIPSFDCDDIGTHTVVLTVTDQSGNAATGTAQVTVVDNTPPTLTCPANVSVTGSSIATYNLPSLTDNCSTDNLSVILLNGMPSGSIFPQGSTTVTYGVLGLGGILTTCTFTVTVTTSIVVTFDINPPSCPGAADGSITAIATGGAAPYSYFWVGSGQTTATATGLGAGVYQVVIVDADGNVVVQTVTLNDPAAMNVSLVFVVDDCDGEGSIDVTVTGGTGPYTFVWTDANGNVVGNTEDLNNVPSGQYTLMITDANGCTFTTGIITVDFTTGVVESELETAGQVQAFPNPTATGLVTFKVNFAETTPVVAEVYNALGQLLASLPQADMQQGQFELNLAAFQPGHYQVKLVTEEGIYTKKVIFLE
jgi:hypothetical protein